MQIAALPLQTSRLHGLPSSVHNASVGTNASTGQVFVVPSHSSPTSHSPAVVLQLVPAANAPSGGQVIASPSQFSAASQIPDAARQSVPELPAGCVQASTAPSHTSRVHTFPSSIHAVPFGSNASVGQLFVEPVHASGWSHSPAALRQGVPTAIFVSVGHAAEDPSQFSAESQSPAGMRQTVVDANLTSAGQVAEAPVQASSRSHTPALARHAVPALPAGCVHVLELPLQTSRVHTLPSSAQTVLIACNPSLGQLSELPSQLSAASHAPLAARHSVPAITLASAGQLVDTPLQLSAVSQTPATPRQTVPALPAGCVHALDAPSHTSRVHTLPSSVQTLALARRTSLGQAMELPSQLSAASHSPFAGRHTLPAVTLASDGQLVDAPVQLSAASHAPAAARHWDPALPAGCVQVLAEPLHVSVVQALPSSGQAAPFDFRASIGHALALPSQVSAVSHVSTAARQDVPATSFASVGHVADEPLHESAASQSPDAARHTVLEPRKLHVPALPATLQDWQSTALAPQAVLQHTPSAQKPDEHPVAVEQAVPFAAKLPLEYVQVSARWVAVLS
jgi:hypothetical protein